MTPLWLAIALMVLGFLFICALVLAAAAIAEWWEGWQGRRYEQSPEEVEWEEHCATTPGVGEVGDTPIFDGLCFDQWEAEGNYPAVYDVDDFPGGAA